jgi:hypothetical protein
MQEEGDTIGMSLNRHHPQKTEGDFPLNPATL